LLIYTCSDLQPPLPESLLDSVLEKACTFLKVSGQPEKEEAKEKTQDPQNQDLGKAIPAILGGVNAVLTSALSMDNKIPCLHRIFQVLFVQDLDFQSQLFSFNSKILIFGTGITPLYSSRRGTPARKSC
jgi:hypothetical protein